MIWAESVSSGVEKLNETTAFFFKLLFVVKMSVKDDDRGPTALSIQIVLLVAVFIFAAIGNCSVCYVVYRYRRLRTIPNLFIVNLSVIDLCNAVVNMPLFAGYYVIEADIFSGKWVTYVCSSLHNYMIYLNVFALLVLMIDRYGAVKYKLRYHAWKTKTKAYLGIAFIWISGTALLAYLGFRRDRILAPYEGLTIMEYRRILYRAEGRKMAVGIVGFPFLGITILGFLVWRTVRASRSRIETIIRGCGCSPQGREMLNMLRINEVQAARTITVVVIAYFVCFVPSIIHGVLVGKDIDSPWSEYFAFFFTYFSSACNPIVYSLRTFRFRGVIREMFTCKPRQNRKPVLPAVLTNVTPINSF